MTSLMGIGASFILGFVPMFLLAMVIYWLDRYEKEPLILLGGMFFWGAVVAVILGIILEGLLGYGAFIVSGSREIESFMGGSIIAPVVEELLKGTAVLLVFLFFYREFDSILDGIVYASIVALGFAASEDVLYYLSAFSRGGFASLNQTFVLRFIFFGWQHPFFTSFIGIGLASARMSRDWLVRILAPFMGLTAAILAHAFHNTLVSTIQGTEQLWVSIIVAWLGWAGMFLYILWQTYQEKRWLLQYLSEEVTLGVISVGQYRSVCALFGQTRARMASLLNGRYRTMARFLRLCGQLSHRKRQYAELGDEGGTWQSIVLIRAELAYLSAKLQ